MFDLSAEVCVKMPPPSQKTTSESLRELIRIGLMSTINNDIDINKISSIPTPRGNTTRSHRLVARGRKHDQVGST